MICTQCGSELRIGTEQVGMDNNHIPIFHRFGYCDNCRIKWDLDLENNINTKNKSKKKSEVWEDIVTAICLIVSPLTLIGIVLMWVFGIPKSKGLRIAATVLFSVYLIVYVFSVGGGSDESANLGNTGVVEESKAVEYDLSVEEKEIYHGNGVRIKTAGIQKENSEIEFDFVVTNESEKDYAVSAHSYVVNGLMAGSNEFGFNTVDVPAGKKGKISIFISNEWMNENGIDKISDIEVIFWGYYDDFKEWDSGNVKVKTNLYSKDERYSVDEKKYYSDDNIAVWYLGSKDDKYYFAIKNRSDYNASYTVENCSVNEWSYEVTDYSYDLYSEPIHKKSYSVFSIEVDKDFMSDNNITTIENIEFDILLEDDYWNYKGSVWNHKTGKIRIENK